MVSGKYMKKRKKKETMLVCVYVYECVCAFVCVCEFKCVMVLGYVHYVCVYECTMYVEVCVCVCVCACVCVSVCVSLCLFVLMCMCECVRFCACLKPGKLARIYFTIWVKVSKLLKHAKPRRVSKIIYGVFDLRPIRI